MNLYYLAHDSLSMKGTRIKMCGVFLGVIIFSNVMVPLQAIAQTSSDESINVNQRIEQSLKDLASPNAQPNTAPTVESIPPIEKVALPNDVNSQVGELGVQEKVTEKNVERSSPISDRSGLDELNSPLTEDAVKSVQDNVSNDVPSVQQESISPQMNETKTSEIAVQETPASLPEPLDDPINDVANLSYLLDEDFADSELNAETSHKDSDAVNQLGKQDATLEESPQIIDTQNVAQKPEKNTLVKEEKVASQKKSKKAKLEQEKQTAANRSDKPSDKNIFDETLSKGEPFAVQDAVNMALNQNPDIQISLEREKQTKFFTREGKSGYYPRIELNAKGEHQYNDPAGGFTGRKGHANLAGEKSFSLNQILFDGFSTIEEVRRRGQLEKSAQIRTRMEEEKVLLDVIKYYSQICQYQRTVVEAQNFIVEMKNIVDKLQLMEKAGGASKAQLDMAQSRLSFATTELNSAVSSLNSAISNLELLTGPLPPIFAHFPDDLNLDSKDMNFYLETAKLNNSNILLNLSEQQALRHRLAAEQGGEYPSLNFRMEGRSTVDDGGLVKTTTQAKATLLLSYVLADGKERSSIESRIKSQIQELNIQDRKNYIDMEKNVKLYYQQLLSKRESLKSIDDEIKSNESLRSLNRQNLKLGNINILEMIDVEERLYTAKSRKQQVLADIMNNSYGLLEQAGILQKAEMETQPMASAVTK